MEIFGRQLYGAAKAGLASGQKRQGYTQIICGEAKEAA